MYSLFSCIDFFFTSTGEEEEKEAMCPILEDKQECEAIDPALKFY